MAVLASYVSGDNTSYAEWIAPYYNLGQTFTVSHSCTLTTIKVKIFRVGTPGVNCQVLLCSTSGGKPNVTLETVAFNGNTITEDSAGAWQSLVFSSSLVAGTYAIRVNGGDDESNAFYWRVDSAAAAYSGGAACWSAAPTGPGEWTLLSGQDFVFEIDGVWDETVPPIDTVTKKRLVACANNKVWYEDI